MFIYINFISEGHFLFVYNEKVDMETLSVNFLVTFYISF